MVRPRGPRGGQTWRRFVQNHASQIFAADLLTQYTAFFTVVYSFVAMEIATRRIELSNATTSPGLAGLVSLLSTLADEVTGIAPRWHPAWRGRPTAECRETAGTQGQPALCRASGLASAPRQLE